MKENLFNIQVESQEQEVSLSSNYGTKVTFRFAMIHTHSRQMPPQMEADSLPNSKHEFWAYRRRDLSCHIEIGRRKSSFPSLVEKPVEAHASYLLTSLEPFPLWLMALPIISLPTSLSQILASFGSCLNVLKKASELPCL